MPPIAPTALLLSLPLASLASAQEFRPVLRENDAVGGGTVDSIDSIRVSDDGSWSALAHTVNVSTPFFRASLVEDRRLLATEPVVIPDLGRPMHSFLATAGTGPNLALLGLANLSPQPSALVIVRAGRTVLMQGQPVVASGAPAGTICRAIETLAGDELDTLLVVARLDGGLNDRGLFRLEFHPDGSSRARTLLLRSGDTLSDGSVVRTIPTELRTLALNEKGQWMVLVNAEDGHDRLVVDGAVVLRSGDPSPLQGRPVAEILQSFDLNDLGGRALTVRVAGSTDTDELLLKNGGILAIEGDVVPSRSPLIPDLELADIGRVRISDSGNVYWQLMTLDAPLGRSSGAFMRDSEIVLQAGASLAGGELVTGFAADPENFQVSPSGRFWLGNVELQISGHALVLADFGAAVPLLGCAAANPATLRLSDGLVLAGTTPHLALDGAVPVGSLGLVHVSLGAARPGEECGILTPFGELLVDPAQRVGAITAGQFAGAALDVRMPIPNSASLVDLELFVQGSFTRPGGGVVLSNGMRLEIGAP